jgi:hypothetical protein
MFNGRRIVALAATTALLGGGAAALAPSSAEAATYKTGTATVKEGRKVVREADKQKCLTLKEVRKYTKANGSYAGEGDYVWEGKGKAAFLVVHFEGKCAGGAALYYDNGDAYAWFDGKMLWA